MGRYVEGVPPGVFDLTKDPQVNLVDESVVTVTLETPAEMVHKIFRQLGNKVILVKKEAHLAGLITKKSFIRHMEAQHTIHAQPSHTEAMPDTEAHMNLRTSRLREAGSPLV